MIKLYCTLLLLCCCIAVAAQKKSALELSLFSRYDKHADYTVTLDERLQEDSIQLYGFHFGVSLQFQQSVTKHLSVYAGVGYSRLSVDKLNATHHPFSGINNSRAMDFKNDSILLPHFTPKYHYNNIVYTIGLQQEFAVKATQSCFVSLEFVDYTTFSQHYRTVAKDLTYATERTGQLGWGVNAAIGLQRQLGSLYLKPALLIPVYQRLRGDEVFDEHPDMRIDKWLNGIGLSVKIGKYLN